jgi:hypothetical protein
MGAEVGSLGHTVAPHTPPISYERTDAFEETFPDPQHWLHDTTFYMYVSLQPESHFEMVYKGSKMKMTMG